MTEPGGTKRAHRVTVVVGAQREAVRMAPVVRALRARPGVKVRLLAVGAPRDWLDKTLDIFGLTPDRRIDGGGGDAGQAALEVAIDEGRPHLLLIQGRSAAAVGAAQHAGVRSVPVGYVDSGMPPTDLRDIDARELGAPAALHFVPTSRARDRLLSQGTSPDTVFVTGSPGIDALHLAIERLDADPVLLAASQSAPSMAGPLVLVLAEHPEAPVAALAPMIRALLSDSSARFLIACDPGQGETLAAALGPTPRVRIVGRIGYLQMVASLREAHLVLTDSSGIEELAPALGTPVLIMRGSTGRPEGIAAGSATLVGTGPTAIAAATTRLLAHPSARAAMANVRSPYGDGLAAWRIAAAIRSWFAGCKAER